METVTMRQLKMTALKVVPWMKLTDDTMFIVDMNKVITMTEVNDKSIIKIYNKYVKERDRVSNKSELSPNMGYVSSIADARISLEKLYRSNR
jgi:aspartate carbamoyltransferase regulatory subunit